MKTYHNLNQYLTPNFLNAGKLILIGNDDDEINIEAGTYTNNITLSLSPANSTSQNQTIIITPIYDKAFANLTTFTPMVINVGQTSTNFRIGLDSNITVL